MAELEKREEMDMDAKIEKIQGVIDHIKEKMPWIEEKDTAKLQKKLDDFKTEWEKLSKDQEEADLTEAPLFFVDQIEEKVGKINMAVCVVCFVVCR